MCKLEGPLLKNIMLINYNILVISRKAEIGFYSNYTLVLGDLIRKIKIKFKCLNYCGVKYKI